MQYYTVSFFPQCTKLLGPYLDISQPLEHFLAIVSQDLSLGSSAVLCDLLLFSAVPPEFAGRSLHLLLLQSLPAKTTECTLKIHDTQMGKFQKNSQDFTLHGRLL